METRLNEKINPPKDEQGGIKGFFKKLGRSDSISSLKEKMVSIYVKRYFMLDTVSSSLRYGDDPKSAKSDPSFQALFRDIESVTRDLVTMPVVLRNKKGNKKVVLKQIQVFGSDRDVDKGPDPLTQHVLEIKLTDKLLTLYTNDQKMRDQFFHYIEQILEFKLRIQENQKIEDTRLQQRMLDE